MTWMHGTTSAGVPYSARTATRPEAPIVVGWHLLDPPSTPAGMAAALPLDGLDAHVIYLGLPLSGERAPHPDFEALLMSGIDMVTEYFGPMHEQAPAEFPAALAELRSTLGASDDSALAVLGGSAGASVAAEVFATHAASHRIAACVLLNPMLRLRPMIDAMAEFLPEPYAWSPAADAVAARMDFVARAGELAGAGGSLLIVEGADDEPAFIDAVREFERLGIGEVRFVDGVAHPLAAWPEDPTAERTEGAKAYDAIVSGWIERVIAHRDR
ncbi:alpha/beta fold hydrolase [Agromyces lapidis]|uniref:Alpha/beta fold hydrolase n=1 Tax=Agromyces lapidis TaxID=279574 RepID=A0ABV5SNK0_9MICO|nr:alpha/beta hydrolase [Agromyces lapidis]